MDSLAPPDFHGLIQPPFALRPPKERQPFTGADISQQVKDLFGLSADGGTAFEVKAIGEDVPDGSAAVDHSPLVKSGSTTVHPLQITFSGADGNTAAEPEPPPAFGWSRAGEGAIDPTQDGPTFVFAEVNPETNREEGNTE